MIMVPMYSFLIPTARSVQCINVTVYCYLFSFIQAAYLFHAYLGVGTLTLSSLSSICTGGSTTIWFHGTKTVFRKGLKGERWNCSVTAPPPLTRTSNLKASDEVFQDFGKCFYFTFISTVFQVTRLT